MTLNNKHILIVGGSSGIGLAIAKQSTTEGAKVTIASRSLEKLNSAKNKMNVSIAQVDINDEESVSKLFANILPIDHLIISAAAVGRGEFETTPLAEAKSIFSNKFWGSYIVAQQSLSSLAESGSITFFSGMTASKPFANLSAITAACCALEGLTKALAKELAPRRVNIISPGLIRTPLLGENPNEKYQAFTDNLLLNRIGNPSEIASAASYLMQNEYVTGQILHIDGGFLLS